MTVDNGVYSITNLLQVYQTLDSILEDVQRIQSNLMRTIGYWRPSFSSFYDYFFWEPLKPTKPIHLTLSDQSLSLSVPLNPLQQVAIQTIWIQHGKKDVISNTLPLLSVSLDSSHVCIDSESYSIAFSSLLLHLLSDEYPALSLNSFTSHLVLHTADQFQSTSPSDSTLITSTPVSLPPSITGHMDLKSLSAGLDYLTLSVLFDHFPSLPLSSSSSTPLLRISLMIDTVCCVAKHPIGMNANLSVAKLDLLLSPDWKAECMVLSLYILRDDECLVMCEGTDMGFSCMESYAPSDHSNLTIHINYAILDAIPSSFTTSFASSSSSISSFSSLFTYFSRLDIHFELPPEIGITFSFDNVSFLSLSQFTIDSLTISLFRINLPPFRFFLSNFISLSFEDGISIQIQSIHSLLSAASLCSLYSLFNQLSSSLFRFTVEKQIQSLLSGSQPSSFSLPPHFALCIHSISLKYRAIHPSANQVQRIACVCVFTNLSLSDQDFLLDWIDVGVTNDETAASELVTSPFPHVSRSESNSSYHPIISIPSISLTFSSSVYFSISSVLAVISSQNLAILILILRDLQTLHVREPLCFAVHPQDLTLHILQSTYHRLKELRWKREAITRTVSCPSILNLPQMYRPTHFSQTEDMIVGIDERQRVEALLNKMVSALSWSNRLPHELKCCLHSLVLQLDDGEAECDLNDFIFQMISSDGSIHVDMTLELLQITASQSTMDNPLSLSPFTLGTSSLESLPPSLHITVNMETGRLVTVHSVVISVAPLRLQFSIPALKSLITFFEAANYRVLPMRRFTQSPILTPIRLKYLRVNAIQVYCALTPTPQAEYALIPFTLNSITLRERVCSLKHILILLRRRLLTDLFSQTSQHVTQASVVVANAMGFSGLVSLLRKPIQLPRHLSQRRKEKEKKKLIHNFLGRKAHIIRHPREDNDVLTCEEESIPGFSNPLFDALRQND